MITETIVLVCIGLFAFQQLFWMRQIQKLVDKIMSKSYAEYEQARLTDKTVQSKEFKLKTDQDPNEDLSVISGF